MSDSHYVDLMIFLCKFRQIKMYKCQYCSMTDKFISTKDIFDQNDLLSTNYEMKGIDNLT